MIELLWLLLPVAAATGWWTGRRGAAEKPLRRSHDAEYYRGLGYLLEDEQDKAIDLFIRMVRVDQDTVETHLALGNLFRRRGEVDRAIRLHQNLIARPNLTKALAGDGQLELARDYFAAGLLDRAEDAYQSLINQRVHTIEAFDGLIMVYEREKEWHAAIGTAKRAFRATGVSRREIIAHYQCEIASDHLAAGEEKQARQSLKMARHFHRDCTRADMMLGDMALLNRKYDEAANHYLRVEQYTPELLSEVIDPLIKALQHCSDSQRLEQFLERASKSAKSFTVMRALAELYERRSGIKTAEAFIKQQLVQQPSLKLLRHWAEIELQYRAKPEDRENIRVVVEMLTSVIAKQAAYSCAHCGFKGGVHHWQCPSCHGWGTMRPIAGDGA
jgi:lipopolysaccharide biosynthesis regulator YciM